jgi:hypothetical protein
MPGRQALRPVTLPFQGDHRSPFNPPGPNA